MMSLWTWWRGDKSARSPSTTSVSIAVVLHSSVQKRKKNMIGKKMFNHKKYTCKRNSELKCAFSPWKKKRRMRMRGSVLPKHRSTEDALEWQSVKPTRRKKEDLNIIVSTLEHRMFESRHEYDLERANIKSGKLQPVRTMSK